MSSCQLKNLSFQAWEVNLLSKQLVVQLDSLHLFVTLLQSLVILTQLTDVVTSFGQDASFTLRNTTACDKAPHVKND